MKTHLQSLDPRITSCYIGKIGAGTSPIPYFIGDIAEILIYNDFEPSQIPLISMRICSK